MFATDEQQLLTQLLPYDETDPINAINIYQVLDQTAPRLNQLSTATLQKHLRALESNFGGPLPSIFQLHKHAHVQLLDADNSYYRFLNQQANVQAPAKELIVKTNKSNDQTDYIKSVAVSKQLDQLFIATNEDPTDYNTANPAKDPISQLHFEFIAIDKTSNQLRPEFNQTLTLDLNQWTSGQLGADLLKFKYQLQTHVREHNLVYVGHNTDGVALTDDRACKFSYLLQYFTGLKNQNDTYFSCAYGIYNQANGQLVFTMLNRQVDYNKSINAAKIRYSRSAATKNQNALMYQFLIHKVFKDEASYQKALEIMAKDRLYADKVTRPDDYHKLTTTVAELNKLINKQFTIKLINAQTQSDAYQAMAQNHHYETEYQQFDQDLYENSHRYLYYADSSFNCNLYVDDPAVAKEYALTFFLYNYHAVTQQLSISARFAQPIIKMIYAQQDLFQPQFTKPNEPQDDTATVMLKQFNASMQEFLSNLHFDTPSDKDNQPIQLSDILNYIYAVKHHQPITPKMLELLVANSNQTTSSQIAINEAYNAKIFDKLHKLDNWKTLPAFQKLSLKDRVTNVYTIDQPQPETVVNVTPSKNSHHVTLVHGTQNFSLISILEKGLLTHHDLMDDNNKHYRYTGSALGDGVYFSRLDQAEKSANYTNAYHSNGTNSFLLIADVNYDKIHDLAHYADQPLQPHENLVWAHGVGSYDRDELVATNKDQVTLRYLVEIKPAD